MRTRPVTRTWAARAVALTVWACGAVSFALAAPGNRAARRPPATRPAPTTAPARAIHVDDIADAAVRSAFRALEKDPANPQANAAAGRFLCYERGDWEAGLPLLAKGDDAALGELARKDLAVTEVPVSRVVLGHDWWDYAKGREGVEKVRCQDRAAWWYRIALPQLEGQRKAEVEKLVATADAEAEALYAKLNAPRPVDPGHAMLDRQALTAADTTPLAPQTLNKDTAFAPAPGGKPYALQGVINVADEPPVKLTFEPGTEIRGGTIDLRQRGHVVAKGGKNKPVVFRGVTFLQDLGASLTAEHAVFDNCQFQKGGAWFSYHSSKWVFADCLLYRCAFGRLTGVDYGFQLRRCALVSMDLPEIAHDRREGFDHMAALRGEWNLIESCDFADCAVPPTVAWCAQKSNFRGCRFKAGEAFDSEKDAEVEAFVKETVGEDAQKVWDANPPKRGKVRLTVPEKPFETTALAFNGRPVVPEVRLDGGRASAAVSRLAPVKVRPEVSPATK